MELSQKIKTMIKGWEGCRLTAYRCPSGVLTIGYGHTGADVRPGMRITRGKADALFETDSARFASEVERVVGPVKLTGNQFDALVSLAYNIGTGALSRSTLLRRVRLNPSDPAIRQEFMKHVNGRVNGVLKRLPGLERRRREEADHYFGAS